MQVERASEQIEQASPSADWSLEPFIEAGVQAADAGELIPYEAVFAWVESWDSAEERPRPA